MRKTLKSGIEISALGRCTSSWCSDPATLAVTLLLHDGGRSDMTHGMCAKHVEGQYLSAEDYAKRMAGCTGNYRPAVFERSRYEIRPLTEQEAAEVAYEQAAPERWKAEGRIGDYRRIVELHSAEKVDGVLVDAQTANACVQLYDHINEKNRKKWLSLDVALQCHMAIRLIFGN